jgi:hypothetical protein
VAVLVLALTRATSERTANLNTGRIGGKMKINNSAELAELIGQIVVRLHREGMVIIPEEVGFQDFEENNAVTAALIWETFERGTLDISATPEDKEFVDYIAEKMVYESNTLRSIVPDDLPTNDDLMDYLEARMYIPESLG